MNHRASIAPSLVAAEAARRGSRAQLARALQHSRRDTLATWAAYQAALPTLAVPLAPELNPPLWEWGHVGWFQAHWTTRNPDITAGWDARPEAGGPHEDDALYDSGRVPHDTRWHLPLPDAHTTRERLQQQLAATLQQLATCADPGPRGLYFHRLALHHEDMHHEAALYMARALGLPVTDARWRVPTLPPPGPALQVPAGSLRLGSEPEAGFCFDNECGAHTVQLAAFEIDAQVLRWAEYLPFVSDGGPMPRYLRRQGTGWEEWRHGVWHPLDEAAPACHLSANEAQAWCRWAGRRLPTEAEWVRAQRTHTAHFRWGQVWEWTSTPFAPWPGFRAHPYRDYSAPWFDGRPVLKGASHLTQPRMRHPDYRNFFPPHRNDIAAGFRTCAV